MHLAASKFWACGSRMQAGASAVRVVLAGIYGQLVRRPLPLSFSLCDGPIVVPLHSLDWDKFEDFEHVRK